MPLEILNPLEVPDWDEQVQAFPNGSIFHSAPWAGVLMEAYGYEPFYVALREKGELKGMIPILEVSSRITGRRGVSLPFTDFCPPLIGGPEAFEALFQYVLQIGEKRGWRYLELRGGPGAAEQGMSGAPYFRHTLSLKGEGEGLFKGIHQNHRRNLRKAEKEGVGVEIRTDEAAMEEFVRLNTRTRRLHGLPPQPRRFFTRLFQRIINRGQGVVALADYQREKVAGAVFLLFGGKAIYKYGASHERFRQLGVNHLVMGKAIQWLAAQGFKELDFGRTDADHEGLRRFKRGWGATESLLAYSRYDLKDKAYRPIPIRKAALSEKVLSRMPYPLLTLIGRLAYRHLG